MATQSVTVVRIYLREGEHLAGPLIRLLHDEERVSGVTLFQGVAGFGGDGKIHKASLLDLSMDLPLVVEFYDCPERIEAIVERLQAEMGLAHIVSWSATGHLRTP